MKRANKFNASPTTVDGIRFDSKREAKRYSELLLLQKAGQIRDLRLQHKIPLQGQLGPLKTRSGRAMRITIDFVYEDVRLNWATVYEDAKGTPTRDYEVRRAVLAAMGVEVIET